MSNKQPYSLFILIHAGLNKLSKMSKPFVPPMALTPPSAKEEQDTEDLKQVYICFELPSQFEYCLPG